jgi:hypothetical protein
MRFFLLVAAPKISEVVQDTKILLQQSRERLIITYVILSLGTLFVANEISSAGSPTICRHMILQNIACPSSLAQLADYVSTWASQSL